MNYLLLFCSLLSGGADRVPDIPLVEADCLPSHAGWDVVLDASQVNQPGSNLNRSLGRLWGWINVLILQDTATSAEWNHDLTSRILQVL